MGLPWEVADRLRKLEKSCKKDSLDKLRVFCIADVTGRPVSSLSETEHAIFESAKRHELTVARILAAAGQHARGGVWRSLVDHEKFTGPFAEMVIKELKLEKH